MNETGGTRRWTRLPPPTVPNYVEWQPTDPAGRAQTLNHEMGHKIGMVAPNEANRLAPGPEPPSTRPPRSSVQSVRRSFANWISIHAISAVSRSRSWTSERRGADRDPAFRRRLHRQPAVVCR